MFESIKRNLKFETSRKDMKRLIFWRDVSCEFWVSTFLMAVVIIILKTNNVKEYQPNTTHFGLFAGFFVYMLLETYGAISCLAHPPATFCLFLAGRLSFARAVFYTAAQVLGCAVGSGIGYALTPYDNRHYVAFNPEHNKLSLAQAVFVEALFTSNVIFVILSTHGEEFHRKYQILPNLAIGCAVGTAIMAAGTFTGGFMNPLIALGPAILSGDVSNHWIYWVGPYIGGIPAVCLYKFYAWVKARDENVPMRVIPPAAESILVESDY